MHLDGAVYGQPVVAPATGGDVVVAATENDTVVALRDGQAIWSTHLGEPVPLGDLPCGNIDPLGITGTPVVDTASRTVYVVAELANPIRHELVALDTSTGAVRWRRTVDPPGSQPQYEQQRAALALAAGRVWVAMGGLFGDCGPYHGKVVGVRSDGGGDLVVYQVPSAREAGIWAPSGPAVGPQGHLFVAVGNGAATSGTWDGSDSVLELDTSGRLVSSFAPAGWAQENARDLDLGSMGPLLLPRGLVVASGKRGDVYVLRQGDLGGVGNPLAQWTGCAAYGGPAADVRSAPSGSVLAYLPCADGDVALRIDLTSGAITRRWHAESAVAGSPVVVGDAVLSVDRTAGPARRPRRGVRPAAGGGGHRPREPLRDPPDRRWPRRGRNPRRRGRGQPRVTPGITGARAPASGRRRRPSGRRRRARDPRRRATGRRLARPPAGPRTRARRAAPTTSAATRAAARTCR